MTLIKNRKTGKKDKKHKKDKKQGTALDRKIIISLIAVCLLIAAGGVIYKGVSDKNKAALEAVRLEEEAQARAKAEEEAQSRIEDNNDEVLGYSVESGINVFEAIKERPPSIELTEENTAEFVSIESCTVDNKTSNITLEASAEGIPISDDKYYYLFALRIHNAEITEDMSPILKEYKDEKFQFIFSRHFGRISGMLYKYVIAVKVDDKYIAVSSPHYVTNPEEVANYKSNGSTATTKKGLLIDPNKLRTPELDDLGVKHAAYNIPVSRIVGQSTGSVYPTINYNYNGKTYAFNGEVMSEYDLVFSTLTNKGIEVTAIILNDVSSAYPQLIHPLARSGIGSAPYYAFNASDEAGTEHLAAIGSFLAERYSGRANGRGVVANWVIGNEINARKEWNYMEHVSLETYVREYAKAYRVFYSVIKTINSASNVYISLDQQWNRNISGSTNYDSRDVLDEFNRQIKEEGNIDWGLAIHPYNVPLTTPYTWNASKYVDNTADTSMVTMKNIEIVTDYMQKEEFLTNDGEVRSIILSEQGYTSLKGEEVQAAAIVYAYKKVEANPYIDSILLSRQTDAVEEVAQGLALGINHADGSHKYAYNVFKYMDTDMADTYTNFAKNIIGISDWSAIIK